jgi:hypothetical protein
MPGFSLVKLAPVPKVKGDDTKNRKGRPNQQGYESLTKGGFDYQCTDRRKQSDCD